VQRHPLRELARNASKTGSSGHNLMNAFLNKTSKAVHDAGGCLAAVMA
jgi:hypothetical protein